MSFKPRRFSKVRADRVSKDLVLCYPRGYTSQDGGGCYFRMPLEESIHRDLPLWPGPSLAIGETRYVRLEWHGE